MRKHACAAFSLVELLISISVISILMCLIMPAVGRARSTARSIQCLGNLRQLIAGWDFYAEDFRDYCMPQVWFQHNPPLYWWGTNGTPSDYTVGFLYPYLAMGAGRDNVFDCPEQPWGSYIPQGMAQAPTTTYGYNGMYLCPPASGWSWGSTSRRWLTLGVIQSPSQVFVLADTLADFGWSALPRNNCLLDGPQYPFGSWPRNPWPSHAFRHRGRSCIAFADGHVGAAHPSEITSASYPIGYVGDDAAPHYVPDWRSHAP